MFFSSKRHLEELILLSGPVQHSEQVIVQWCARSAVAERQQVAHRAR